MDVLPPIGLPHPGFEPELKFVRSLEEYEGPILTEYAAESGATYVEKWCTQTLDGRTFRSLLVRADLRSIELYLMQRVDLRTLLESRSDGFGFLVDQTPDDPRPTISVVTLQSLPSDYLPAHGILHDPSLHPRDKRARQLFLLEDPWSGEQIGHIERTYLDAAAFCYFAATRPSLFPNRRFPNAPLQYKYRRGFPIAKAFSSLRQEQPAEARGRTVFVQAASPGILAIEVDTATAEHLRASVAAVRDIEPFYRNVQTWASHDIDDKYDLPADAADDVRRLADALHLDLARFDVHSSSDGNERTLTLGKLLTSYFRKLRKLATLQHAEFVGRR